MGFIAVKCPSCGADVQFGDNNNHVLCSYCGAKLERNMVHASIMIENIGTDKNFLNLAQSAYGNSNYQEAYFYFTKVLEINVSNYCAQFYKGMCAGYLSNPTKPRIKELIGGYLTARSQLEALKLKDAENTVKYSAVQDEYTNTISAFTARYPRKLTLGLGFEFSSREAALSYLSEYAYALDLTENVYNSIPLSYTSNKLSLMRALYEMAKNMPRSLHFRQYVPRTASIVTVPQALIQRVQVIVDRVERDFRSLDFVTSAIQKFELEIRKCETALALNPKDKMLKKRLRTLRADFGRIKFDSPMPLIQPYEYPQRNMPVQPILASSPTRAATGVVTGVAAVAVADAALPFEAVSASIAYAESNKAELKYPNNLLGFKRGKWYFELIGVLYLLFMGLMFIGMIGASFDGPDYSTRDKIILVCFYLFLWLSLFFPYLVLSNVGNLRNKIPLYKSNRVGLAVIAVILTVVTFWILAGIMNSLLSDEYRALASTANEPKASPINGVVISSKPPSADSLISSAKMRTVAYRMPVLPLNHRQRPSIRPLSP